MADSAEELKKLAACGFPSAGWDKGVKRVHAEGFDECSNCQDRLECMKPAYALGLSQGREGMREKAARVADELAEEYDIPIGASKLGADKAMKIAAAIRALPKDAKRRLPLQSGTKVVK